MMCRFYGFIQEFLFIYKHLKHACPDFLLMHFSFAVSIKLESEYFFEEKIIMNIFLLFSIFMQSQTEAMLNKYQPSLLEVRFLEKLIS